MKFQAFCSSVNGTIATQSIMQGLGVGAEATTALAATMTWVLKGNYLLHHMRSNGDGQFEIKLGLEMSA